MTRSPLIFVLAASSFCLGCKVEPKYAPPTAPVPAAYQTVSDEEKKAAAAQGWLATTPNDAQLHSKWWEIYQDPELNALEGRIEIDNQSLKAATARFSEARALVEEFRAKRLPEISAGGDAMLDRLSRNKGNAPLAGKSDFNDFSVGLSAAWEPDLWGRVHTIIAASVQQAQASAADLEGVRLSLHAELAADYLMLRSLDHERAVLHDSVDAYSKALQITEQRYTGGMAPRIDVEQARTQLEATEAQETDLAEGRAHYQNAIAVLTGQLPENFTIAAKVHALLPPAIPLGMPAQLLERRPDIAANERRMALANSQVGLAHEAFYPQVILSGAVGMQSKHLSNWYDAPSRYWAVGPMVSQSIFDGGRRRAALAQSVAGYDEAVANYRESVLSAFRQVEDNLTSLHVLDEEQQRQQRAVESARRAEELSLHRYEGGLVTYLEVVHTQTVQLANERVAIGIERRRMQASVALIRALGGGWDASALPQPASFAKKK